MMRGLIGRLRLRVVVAVWTAAWRTDSTMPGSLGGTAGGGIDSRERLFELTFVSAVESGWPWYPVSAEGRVGRGERRERELFCEARSADSRVNQVSGGGRT